MISNQKSEHVNHIMRVVFQDRANFWPLSIRGAHYALLNYTFLRNTRRKLSYKNDRDSYQATSDLIARLRLKGTIPWQAFDDFTRPTEEFRAFPNVREFVRQEMLGRLFTGYWRDLLQSQPNHIECVVEKNTVYPLALRVTQKYQIHTMSGRGFSGIDPWHDLHQRFTRSGKLRLLIVLLSDYDPEGELIPHVAGRTLRDDFGISEDYLTIIKAGVTPKQIEAFQLASMNFANEESSNRDWFVKRNGGNSAVFELEALRPEDMMADLETAIRGTLDIELFNREVEIQNEEAAYLQTVRLTATDALKAPPCARFGESRYSIMG
jgi:hypothetical protein